MARPGTGDGTYVQRSELRQIVEQMLGEETWLATDAELAAHETDTTNIHGIADTSLLALKSELGTLGEESVETKHLKNLAVTAAKLGAEAVEAGKIKTGAVSEAKLAAESVGNAKIKNEAVTEPKINATTRQTLIGKFNVKDAAYGAKGDGATDDSTAIQAAITAAEAAGGGIVFFPTGTYIVGTSITYGSNIRFLGTGWTTSIIKAKNTSNIVIFEGKNYATTGVANGAFEHLQVHGNKANNTTTAGIKQQSQNSYFYKVVAVNCNSHGFNVKLTTEGEKETVGLDNHLESCRAVGCEDRGFNIEAHDTSLTDCVAIQCKEYGFYWTVNGYMHNCHSWCYDSTLASATKTGYRLATSVQCVNCIAEGATERQIEIVGNVIGWIGGEVFNGASKPNAALFEFNGGTTARILDPWLHEFGTGGAFKFTTTGAGSIIRANCFDTGGNPITNGTPAEDIRWDIGLGGGTGIGNADYFKRQQITFTKFTPGTVHNNTAYVDNGDGMWKFKDNLGTTRIIGTPSEEEIASAGTIAPSFRISAVKLTGTTEVTKITATYAGHIVTIRFTANTTIKHGENISLQGGVNMQGANNNTITLVCDGTTWRELCRQQSADGGTVASANTITIPLKSRIVKISGSAEIKKIEPTYAGHYVVFITTETAKFVDGENLKLTATTAAGSADDAFALICDGTNWFQVSTLQAN